MKFEHSREINEMQKMLQNGSISKSDIRRLEQTYNIKIEQLEHIKLEDYLSGDALPSANYYKELEMSSEYIDCHEDISLKKTSFPLHSHSFYEILYVRSGNLQYLVDNHRFQLQKNDIVFIPPETSHCPLFLEELKEPYSRIVMWANADFFDWCREKSFGVNESMKRDFDWSQYVIRTSGSQLNRLEYLFTTILKEKMQGKDDSEFYCITLAQLLFCNLYRAVRSHNIETTQPEKEMLLDEIMQYINVHLAEELSLEGVAREFHVSTSTVSKLFKNQMGSSFYQSVTQLRLIEAKNHIMRGTPLKSIPSLCGFSDYSTFYRSFKKAFGISPKDYRNRE